MQAWVKEGGPNLPRVPAVAAVASYPYVWDGTVVSEPGLDEKSRVLLVAPPGGFPKLPSSELAREIIEDWFGEVMIADKK